MSDTTDDLNALRDILKEISAQDEQIWRRQAREKYLKEEINKLNIQIKNYDDQINMFKTDPAHTHTEEMIQLLESSINEQVSLMQSQISAIFAKNAKIEHMREDQITWQQKYASVIAQFKEAYESRLDLYEKSNPLFKEYRKNEKIIKLSQFELKNLRAQMEAKKNSSRQLEHIRKLIQRANIVHFAESVTGVEKHQQILKEIKTLEEAKKEYANQIFELQEELKRRQHQKNQRNMQNMNICSMRMEQDMQKIREKHVVREIRSEIQNEKSPIDLDKPNSCIILRNDEIKPAENPKQNQLTLSPLSAILASNQSKWKDFKKVPREPEHISCENEAKKGENIEKINDVLKPKKLIIEEIPETPIANVPIKGIDTQLDAFSMDYLNNIEFTIQPPRFDENQKPATFSHQDENKKITSVGVTSQVNAATKEDIKRKLAHVENVDTMFPKPKKFQSVSFASPLEIQCNMNEYYSQESNRNEKTLFFLEPNADSFNMSLDRPIMEDISLSEVSAGTSSPCFNFSTDNLQIAGNISNMAQVMNPPASLFPSSEDKGASIFKFSFGNRNSKKMEDTWDLFN